MNAPFRLRTRHWDDAIAKLDAERDAEEICRILANHVFPLEVLASLEIAQLRTFTIPTISAILHSTGQYEREGLRRLDDTRAILGEIVRPGLDSEDSRRMVEHLNDIHSLFRISNDDYVTACAGIPCVLKDTTKAKALAGRSYSAKLLEKAMAAGRADKLWAEEVLSAIEATSDAGDLAGCDMIIEAVFEDRVLKAEVTQEAEAHTESGTLMCSNTSTLPITGLAKASRAPQNFVGLHFFSPVDRMPLVEIIVGKETSDETLARAMDFVLSLKKTPIVVNDSRGFFTSRVFSAFVMEGIRMVAEGWNPASIEQAALQNGSPVGPLAVCDEVSLELTRKVREQAKKDLAEEGKPAPPASPADEVVERMCLEFGRRGKAAGAGFYDYAVGGKKVLWPGLSKHFVRPERARPTETEFAELKERLQYITSIESLRCLDEGVVRTVADANVGSVLGIGAPARTGGVLQFVNHVGVRPFAERARALEGAYGERFRPPEALLEAERTGAKFE